MSSAETSWRASGAGARPAVLVAVAAALVALGLGGHGLLVPAGPETTTLRVAGALVALLGVGVLLRLDGPTIAARTLVLVTVAGALTGLATLPWSPVTLSDASPPSTGPDARGASTDDGIDTVVLDRVGPDTGAADASGTLRIPGGATVGLDGDQVVLHLPDGSTSVLGRATVPPAESTPAAPAPGTHPQVVVTDGVVGRGDGGPLGGDTPLGGVTFEGVAGRRVVVGEGVLLDVPDPIPTEPRSPLSEGADAVLAALLACFALLAFAPPVVRVAARIRPRAAVPEPPPSPAAGDAGQVEEGLAEVLRAMLADPDPRTAIIGAYARLLTALAAVGFARRDEETPHEHLWRVLGPLGVRPAPVHRLAELFVQARFTPRPLTDVHRDAAVAALADAVGDLRLSTDEVPVRSTSHRVGSGVGS